MAPARGLSVVSLSATALVCLVEGSALSQMGGKPAATPVAPNQQPLIDLLEGEVAADNWDTVGGPGAIKPFDVGQTAKPRPPQTQAGSESTPPAADPPTPLRLRTIHPQVSRLSLAREYRSVPLIDSASAELREKVDAALERAPELAEFDFQESPLREVAERLAKFLSVPVRIDSRALEDLGLEAETPITFTSQGESCRAVLRQMLKPIDLAWIVTDEVLLITTTEKVEENLEVRLYPMPWGHTADCEPLIDLIQSTVAADTWDTVGGPAAIRQMDVVSAAQLVVSTTQEVHHELELLLRGLHEQALAEFGAPQDPAGKVAVVKLHHVADAKARGDLAAKLPELCNASLAEGVDPEVRVTVVGESLAVQSRSPEFHALAGQIIRAVAGEQVPDLRTVPAAQAIPNDPANGAGFGAGKVGGGMGMGGMGRGFCWVARAVYGEADPRWLLFRSWLTADAPRWLHDAYAAHGEAFAAWIDDKPVGKAAVRLLMDQAVGSR